MQRDSTENKTKFLDAITQQREEYMKMNGVYPSFLIISDVETKRVFFNEVIQNYQFARLVDEFNGQEKFLGMTIVYCGVSFGGSMKWGFGK